MMNTMQMIEKLAV